MHLIHGLKRIRVFSNNNNRQLFQDTHKLYPLTRFYQIFLLFADSPIEMQSSTSTIPIHYLGIFDWLSINLGFTVMNE